MLAREIHDTDRSEWNMCELLTRILPAVRWIRVMSCMYSWKVRLLFGGVVMRLLPARIFF